MKGEEDGADGSDDPFLFPDSGEANFSDKGNCNQDTACNNHSPRGNGDGRHIRAEPDEDCGK